MFLKKVESRKASEMANRTEISVVIEPMHGHEDRDVVKSLEETGASEIKVLAPGYISAQINPSAFKLLESIAYIHPKQKQSLRRVA